MNLSGDDAGRYILAKQGEYYLVYSTEAQDITVELYGDHPYKIDAVDTWNMKILPIGTAQPGEYTFTSPHADFAYRFTPYTPGEKIRPEVKASADNLQGSAPLTVNFSAEGNLTQSWDFGDGTISNESNPTHTYQNLGQYTTILTVTDAESSSSTTALTINVLPAAPAAIGTHIEFPGSRERLIFFWHNTLEDSNEIELLNGASITEDGQLDVSDGTILPKNVNETLLAECQKSNQFTLECLITTDNLSQSGPARIITFSNDITHRNFTLGQDNNRLAVRIRTPRTGENGLGGEFSFGKIESGIPLHIIVSYFEGNTYCYIDGELVYSGNGHSR